MNCLALIHAETSLWNEPRLAAAIAAGAVTLLLATVWLMRRKSRDGRGAAAICLVLSIALHALLIFFLPALKIWGGGAAGDTDDDPRSGISQVTISDFDPAFDPADISSLATEAEMPQSLVTPLPLLAPVITNAVVTDAVVTDAVVEAAVVKAAADEPLNVVAKENNEKSEPESESPTVESLPSSLASSAVTDSPPTEEPSLVDDLLSQWLSDDAARTSDAKTSEPANSSPADDPMRSPNQETFQAAAAPSLQPHIPTPASSVPGLEQNDFGLRSGNAKRQALLATGGDDSTEAAVEAALQFLAADQRADGAWDPVTSGAGRETLTLGTDRGGAGKRATNGITGLALLSMLGAGNTHLDGAYADNVRRGLSYLIGSQQPDGSLAGPATPYEANYCHGMAALAMCEAAVMTGDESAIRSAAAAVRFTTANQHPTTGGWRYIKGDPGDLSQLGWQAMVIDGGKRASIPVSPSAIAGASTFLRSVRAGQNGGLACYRPGEAPTRTMTAEALATRLLLGESIPQNEIDEAEAFLLRQPPGVGKDNYYGWYYTSLALHQLQDDAWRQWNASMKSRLLSRQLPGGSWPTDDEWGGYGGRVYTTAMATLCLEVYYRHALRSQVARGSESTWTR